MSVALPSTLHILLDPSGAYLCLDYSVVCSHLDSLFTRLRVHMKRGDVLKTYENPAAWQAYFHGQQVLHKEAVPLPGGDVDAVVRQTHEQIIMGPPIQTERTA